MKYAVVVEFKHDDVKNKTIMTDSFKELSNLYQNAKNEYGNCAKKIYGMNIEKNHIFWGKEYDDEVVIDDKIHEFTIVIINSQKKSLTITFNNYEKILFYYNELKSIYKSIAYNICIVDENNKIYQQDIFKSMSETIKFKTKDPDFNSILLDIDDLWVNKSKSSEEIVIKPIESNSKFNRFEKASQELRDKINKVEPELDFNPPYNAIDKLIDALEEVVRYYEYKPKEDFVISKGISSLIHKCLGFEKFTKDMTDDEKKNYAFEIVKYGEEIAKFRYEHKRRFEALNKLSIVASPQKLLKAVKIYRREQPDINELKEKDNIFLYHETYSTEKERQSILNKVKNRDRVVDMEDGNIYYSNLVYKK